MKVRLSNYNEIWIELFQNVVDFLRTIFGDIISQCEHFGSTSVPGLKAKPVIDMMCLVKDLEKVDLFNEKMSSFGYDVAGD